MITAGQAILICLIRIVVAHRELLVLLCTLMLVFLDWRLLELGVASRCKPMARKTCSVP